MRTTVLMTALIAASMAYSPELLACANSMEGEALVGTGTKVFFASVSGIAAVGAAALFFFRIRRSNNG